MGRRFGFGRFTALVLCSLLVSYSLLVLMKWSSEPSTAVHEAGHAVAYYVGFGKAPYRMALTTLRPGGQCGYTITCDGDDCRKLSRPSDLWNDLVMLLAGMVAASSREGGDGDTYAALEIIGVLQNLEYMGQDILPPWPHGLSGRKLSQDDIINEAWRRAVAVIAEHRRQVDVLAAALLRRGDLDHEEIETILLAAGE